MGNRRKKIWIDLENTPHIPFFAPIIRELGKRGYEIILTARDAYQTCEMADLYGFRYKKIGRHFGKRKVLKALGLCLRSSQLVGYALREQPDLALSHGSRSQIVACNLVKIPSVQLEDYEYSGGAGLDYPTWMIVPEAIAEAAVKKKHSTRLRHYHGIKEDVYAPELKPDPSVLRQLGLADGNFIIASVRPPATEAHYHNAESEQLLCDFMERALGASQVKVVLLPRNERQKAEITRRWPGWFKSAKVVIPERVVDGINLLWHSDLVVSGGGTMNREAAALGVPVYSIFRGRIGAVDRQLETEGRLTMIRSAADVAEKILFRRREKSSRPGNHATGVLDEIVQHIDSIAALECPA